MRILRNIFRRKLRAILTILGIVIGVFVLVVMGSLAEKITLLVEGGTKYYSDKVSVSEADFIFGDAPMSVDRIGQLEKVDGVNLASGTISLTLDDSVGAVNFGPPPLINASDYKGDEIDQRSYNFQYLKGRKLKVDDIGKVVVGSDLVKKLNAEVNKKITIRDKEFEVVGILEKTLTVPDTSVTISLADAQQIYWDTLPEAVRGAIDQTKLINGITVYPQNGIDANELAKKIKTDFPNLKPTGPKDFESLVASSTAIFTSLIFGVALISLLVGGLSVVNTMTMSISERIREIGIRKAIGASKIRLIRQFVAESAVMSIIGGMLGLFFGWLFVYIINSSGNDSGTTLFLITPRLAIGSLVFALLLGVISGIIPAWRAAKMKPVEALRYE